MRAALNGGWLSALLALTLPAAAAGAAAEDTGFVSFPAAVRQAAAPATETADPVCTGYRLVAPGRRVTNGSALEFYSYWDAADSVVADLSLLDATLEAPLTGTYVGDSSFVAGDTLHVWSVYWFTHVVASDNPRPDGDGIAAAITGFDTASGASTTNEALRFCLANHPPAALAARVVGPAERFTAVDGDSCYMVRSGDSLFVHSTWEFGLRPFMTTADFSAVDDSFSSADVFYRLVSASGDTLETHEAYYELSTGQPGGTDTKLPVRIHGADGGCGRDSVTLWLWVDNVGPDGAVRLDVLPETVTAAGVTVSGTAPAGAHDVLVRVNQSRSFTFDLTPAGDSLIFSGEVTLQSGSNEIVAYARDVLGNRSDASESQSIDFAAVPVFKGWRSVQPDTLGPESALTVPVANGDLIVIHSYWDTRADYIVAADFGALDSAYDSTATLVTRIADTTVAVGDTTETWATYRIEYPLSETNTISDGDDYVVPVTAIDPSTGNQTRTESLRFCLSNHPPEHIDTYFDAADERFIERDGQELFLVRNGGTVYIVTSWKTPGRLRITADFSALDDDYVSDLVRSDYVDSLSSDSTATYLVYYEFSLAACCAEGKEPYPLPATLRVTERDGCGSGERVLWFEMDNEGPSGAATWSGDPPPEETTVNTLTVRGAAPEGAQVGLIEVLHVAADSTTRIDDLALDAERGFSAAIPLLAGDNEVTLYGRDAVGNRSAASATAVVRYVTTATQVTVPKLLHPGDTIAVEDRDGWTEVTIEIYNLAGSLIRRWEERGALQRYYAVQWDGRNGDGTTVRQGAYLVRVATTTASGRTEEEVKAVVFQH